MTDPDRPTILCVSSYFKGNRFLQRAKREGARVYLLTLEPLREAPWAREALDDLFVMPGLGDLRQVINGVAYLMRTQRVDSVVALDDYDVELAAALREHFRLPGLGQSTARFFRDKLAMRIRARELGIAVPEFVPLFHHEAVKRFLAGVSPPWLMKPRGEASSIGIEKLHEPEQVWQRLTELGDDASFHLLERFVPSDLYHVDSLVHRGAVVFAEVGAYHRPLLDVYTAGGIFATRTARRDSPEAKALGDLNALLVPAFGLHDGCSHTEFLRAHEDGTIYFLETSCRVGGACISDMVEAATGVNLWEEWAAIEVASLTSGRPYRAVSPTRQDFAGAVVSLARTERPDSSDFDDPEVCHRLDQKHHIGLVVRSPSEARVQELLSDYLARIARDHQAVLPPSDRATA